jgi:integrase
LQTRFQGHLADAGVTAAYTLHSLRRGLTQLLDNEGVPTAHAMRVLGMSSTRTHARYLNPAAAVREIRGVAQARLSPQP